MPRQIGSRNKLSTEIKQRISDALNDSIDNLENDLSLLTTKERLEIVCRLLPYILPKLKETEHYTTDSPDLSEIKVNIFRNES